MTTRERGPAPRPKRRQLRFGLRTLFVAVTLTAIALGIWTEHVRWHVARLANPNTAESAFDRVMEIHAATRPELGENMLAWRKVMREQRSRRFRAWPQRPGSFLPGYVWVLEEGTIYAVSPRGETNSAGIIINGPPPDVLWNGTLPDGRPGIVVFNNVIGSFGYDGYLIGISTRVVRSQETEVPVVRLFVRVRRSDVTAELLPDAPTPTIVLRSADGKIAEEFSFPHGALSEREREEAKTSDPWQLQTRW